MTSHLLSGLYHLEIGGCMGFVGVKQNSRIWQMLVDKLKRQRNVLFWFVDFSSAVNRSSGCVTSGYYSGERRRVMARPVLWCAGDRVCGWLLWSAVR